jgi:hypothetical protein
MVASNSARAAGSRSLFEASAVRTSRETAESRALCVRPGSAATRTRAAHSANKVSWKASTDCATHVSTNCCCDGVGGSAR